MDALVDSNVVAERLNVSVRTVRRLIARDEIPHVRIGNSIRFDPRAIELWLEGRRRGAEAA